MRDADAQLVLALYDGIVESAAPEAAIAALARRFSCHSGVIISFDPMAPQASVAASMGSFDASAQRRYETDFVAHDPAPRAFAAMASGTAVASDRLFTPEFRRTSVMLHEFLRPLGIEETLGGTVSARDGRFTFLTVHRGKDRASFDDDEIASVEQLLPYVNRALQLRRVFAQLKADADLMAGMIDRLSAGVVVSRGDGSAVHVNAAARTIAAREDGLRFDGRGGLHTSDRAAERLLAQHSRDAASGGPGGIVRVPRRGGGQAYAVLIAPAPKRTASVMMSDGDTGVFTVIHDPDLHVQGASEAIATILGIPDGAARLLAALMQGDDTKSYADRHGVSYETVRYHLKTAFARTGVRTQGRLMQLVTRALTEFDNRRGR